MRMVVILVVVIVLALGGWWLVKKPTVEEIKNTQTNQIDPTVLKVVAAGDISCPEMPVTSTQCQQKSTADLIQRLNPDLVLALGDIQYGEGSLKFFNQFYNKSWGVFKTKTRPAVGNHEYEEAKAGGYFDYFNGVGKKTGLAGDNDKGYYSFEKSGWKFIVLNSNCWAIGGCEADSPQGRWLKQELQSADNSCQLVTFHHPLYSSGQHGINEMVRPLWNILYDNKVEIVLNGHDHLYERFALQDSEGFSNPYGIREFVVGTGGRSLYQFKNILPNSEVRINDKFGVLELDLKADQYSWKFISIDNQVLDSGEGGCLLNQASM